MYKKIIKYFGMRHRVPAMVILCLLAACAAAQAYVSARVEDNQYKIYQQPLKPQQTAGQGSSVRNSNPKKKIEIIYSHLIRQDEGVEYQLLLDSVQFYHDGAKLFCDSAHYNKELNIFEAFSNVRMEQGDTLFLYGDYMEYDGNTKLAKVRENVRMENGSSTLFTDNLDFDRVKNIGYYFDGGMLVDSNKDGENVLTSFWGQYEPNIKLATFMDSVKLVNPKFTLTSDMLKYNTNNKIAFITKPATIVSDSGIIYTSNARYNTDTEKSILLDRSLIVNKEGNRTLTGDSIIFDRATGQGEAFGHMSLQDTTKKVILRGDYGFFNEVTEFTYATDSAYCIEYSQGDSLFLSADTLKMQKDSIYRDMLAYHNVRFYRSDMQGVCDSMQFNTRDSVLHMYRDPILWNNKNQLTGDTIDIFMNDSTIDYVHVKRYSFSIEQTDSIRFNQLKGRTMRVFFENKDVRHVLVEGDANSIFYPKEDNKDPERDGEIIGLNRLESSYFEIFFKDKKFEKLRAWPKPVAKMTPLEMVIPDQTKLPDFYWYDYLRPLDKDDIFRRVSKKASDIKPKRSSDFDKAMKQAEEDQQ